jgi:leucyl/phenylalanyl-tRNA--protein transferase
MYSKLTGGSKVAISWLISISLLDGIELLDCQMPTAHLRSLGMQEIPRSDFLALLARCVKGASALPEWRLDARNAAELAALRRLSS